MLKWVKIKSGVSTYSKVASIIYVMLSKGPDARESSARQTPRMCWKGIDEVLHRQRAHLAPELLISTTAGESTSTARKCFDYCELE
jgi:hypothetical protein